MNTRRLLTLCVCALVGGVFLGCQNSPGSISSPKSDIYVNGISPTILAPDTSGKLPYLAVSFNITNGVSVFLDSADIRFFTQNGQKLASGSLDNFIALSQLIKAKELGGVQAETSTAEATSISFEVYSPRVFSYITNGTLDNLTDDIVPIIAKVEIHGRDTNGNQLTVTTQATISTTPKTGQ